MGQKTLSINQVLPSSKLYDNPIPATINVRRGQGSFLAASIHGPVEYSNI